ncbi:hypothetical protein J6590_091450 [Homalodisca vitripennis]|nr:hypothetical protein J6590_091450 [Homalodisca vitripennis]
MPLRAQTTPWGTPTTALWGTRIETSAASSDSPLGHPYSDVSGELRQPPTLTLTTAGEISTEPVQCHPSYCNRR